MLDETWRDPPDGHRALAGTLLGQLTQRPDLARMIRATPELADSLTARPLTLHHLAAHPAAVDALGLLLDEAAVRGEDTVAYPLHRSPCRHRSLRNSCWSAQAS